MCEKYLAEGSRIRDSVDLYKGLKGCVIIMYEAGSGTRNDRRSIIFPAVYSRYERSGLNRMKPQGMAPGGAAWRFARMLSIPVIFEVIGAKPCQT